MVYRFVDADTERLHGLAADLGRLNPDVIPIAGYREIRAEGWARIFPLDSFGRASRSLGGDPREVSDPAARTRPPARDRAAVNQKSFRVVRSPVPGALREPENQGVVSS
jgi:hypothetical protein